MNNPVNQPYGAPPPPANFCPHCNAVLIPGRAFCPSCGAPVVPSSPTSVTTPINNCPKCGSILQSGASFCAICGSPVATPILTSTPSRFLQCTRCGTTLPGNAVFCSKCGSNELIIPSGINPQTGKKKSKASKFLIGFLITILVIAFALIIIPALHVSPEELMEEGNYIEAYEKADTTTEKDEILAENVIAVLSAESADKLKNPSSFELRQAYYYPFLHEDGDLGSYVILYISGTNSYGGRVSSYWVYTLDKNQEWNFLGTSDVTHDREDDELADMLVKIVLRAGIEKGIELDSEQVSRINQLFEDGLLDDVDAIDWALVDTSNFTQD